jgi:proline iminopeptidase
VALHGGPGLDGSVWFPGLDPLADEGWRVLAPDHRGNGRSDAGDPARWTVPQMADDVEALLTALALDRPVVMGWSFGSFVAQAHMAQHCSASAYVLMGTIADPAALELVGGELERFQPERLRAQVTASWEREATVQTAEECRQLLHDQYPFHFADPDSPMIAQLIEQDRIVYRPEVLRHFAADGDYGLADRRPELCVRDVPVLVLSGEHDRTTAAVRSRARPGAAERRGGRDSRRRAHGAVRAAGGDARRAEALPRARMTSVSKPASRPGHPGRAFMAAVGGAA